MLKYNSLENDQHLLFESEDLAEYMEKKFGVVSNDGVDDFLCFDKQQEAVCQIDSTIKGLLHSIGTKVNIDLKF
jgi:hypothetical protein